MARHFWTVFVIALLACLIGWVINHDQHQRLIQQSAQRPAQPSMQPSQPSNNIGRLVKKHPNNSTDRPFSICLLGLGQYDAPRLKIIERGIRYVYGFEVKVIAAHAMPTAAWYSPRQRYRADQILNWMDKQVIPQLKHQQHSNCDKYLAYTRHDISTSLRDQTDWGVMGLAQLGGRAGLVSSFRLHHGLIAPNTANRRLVKVANHELGHLLNIPHLNQSNCLMQDAEGSLRHTDQSSGLLCDGSAQDLKQRLNLTVPEHTTIDWQAIEY